MLESARLALKKIAYKILDVDDTVKPEAHLKLFEDYLHKFDFDTNTNDIMKLLEVLKKKHLVDEIIVTTLNGSSIASTNGNGVSEAVAGAALYNYIKSEIPKSDSILIKSDGWYMLFPLNNKLYIVKASASLTNVELQALAKELNTLGIAKSPKTVIP